MVQPQGRNGQRQRSGCSGQRPSTRPPAQGHTQTQKSPAVSGQGREGGRLHTDPFCTSAPFLSQRNGPVEQIKHYCVETLRHATCFSKKEADQERLTPIHWSPVCRVTVPSSRTILMKSRERPCGTLRLRIIPRIKPRRIMILHFQQQKY